MQGDFGVDQKVRDFYNACQKFPHKEKRRHLLAHQFAQTLKNVGLEGWPFTEKAFGKRKFAWYTVVPKMIEEAVVYTDGRVELPIVNIEVGVNDLTKNEYVLKINSPDFDEWDGTNFDINWLDYDLGEWPHYRKMHFTLALRVMSALNTTDKGLIYERLLNRSIEIDSTLFNISIAAYESRYKKFRQEYGKDSDYKNTTLNKLPSLPCGVTSGCAETIEWTSFIDSLLVASGAFEKKTSPNQKILIKDPYYFETFDEALRNLTIHPYEMANYMGWKILVDYIIGSTNLYKAFRGSCMYYLTVGLDDNSYTDDGLLNVAVGSMYAREYFSTKKKEEALKQVAYIRKSFEFLVPHISWMDKETQSRTIEKFNAMGQFIAYPDELLDREIMDDYYEGLEISKDDHVGNIKNLGKFLTTKTFSKLGKTWSVNDWTNSMAQVVKVFNAYYRPSLNQFVLPAGYMHRFNFDIDQPMYLNYPVNGATIGHEMLHGFDNSGRNWDKKGVYLDAPGWWTNKTYVEYDQRAKCVVDAYESLVVTELDDKPRIDGRLTLGENIADIGGNRLTYYAYQLWVNDHGEEPLLPGLTDFNQRQMFWIRNAHQWCGKTSKERLRKLLKDVHTPARYRLMGSVMLSDEFAADFKCPKGSPMNPVQNCSVGSLWPRDLASGITTMLRNNPATRGVSFGIPLESSLVVTLFSMLGIVIWN